MSFPFYLLNKDKENCMNNKKVRPFGVKDQLGYVCGDMAGSFVNLFVDSYFLTFCTYVLGINPAWLASLFLVARLCDEWLYMHGLHLSMYSME